MSANEHLCKRIKEIRQTTTDIHKPMTLVLYAYGPWSCD